MQIQLLCAPGCGHREQAALALGKAMQELGLRGYVEGVRVTTRAEAERYGMVGSPTILLNGRDIAPGRQPSLECRRYQRDDGGQQGWPNVELLKWALEVRQTPLACCG